MKRRDLLKAAGMASGHVMFPAVLSGFLQSCSTPREEAWIPEFFSADEAGLIQEIIDIIIPKTDSPSATYARTHEFLDKVFLKCIDSSQQTAVRDGLLAFAQMASSGKDIKALVEEVDQQAYGDTEDHPWFKMLKKYAMVGYFTSLEGGTRATRYYKTPGGYVGEIPADEETISWTKTYLQYNL